MMLGLLELRNVAMAMAAVCVVCIIRPTDALTCYSCTSATGSGSCGTMTSGNSTNNNNVPTESCSNQCLTTITTLSGSLIRSCAPSSSTIGSGCNGIGSLKVCLYYCSTDLCNTQNGKSATRSSILTSVIALILTAIYVANKVV